MKSKVSKFLAALTLGSCAVSNFNGYVFGMERRAYNNGRDEDRLWNRNFGFYGKIVEHCRQAVIATFDSYTFKEDADFYGLIRTLGSLVFFFEGVKRLEHISIDYIRDNQIKNMHDFIEAIMCDAREQCNLEAMLLTNAGKSAKGTPSPGRACRHVVEVVELTLKAGYRGPNKLSKAYKFVENYALPLIPENLPLNDDGLFITYEIFLEFKEQLRERFEGG